MTEKTKKIEEGKQNCRTVLSLNKTNTQTEQRTNRHLAALKILEQLEEREFSANTDKPIEVPFACAVLTSVRSVCPILFAYSL